MIALALALVIGGTPDTAHVAVVSVTPGCSGVVIAPRVVLTAGHCAAPASRVEIEGRVLLIAEKHIYHDFTGTPSDEVAGLDLAALVLADDAGVAPLAWARTPPIAGPGTVVGLGGGARKSAPVAMQPTCERLLGFGDLTHDIEGGDSGGALLVGDTLVGIVSFHDTGAPPAFAVRTDAYARWIDAVVAGTPDDACARTCPPAASDCYRPPSADSGCSCSIAHSNGTAGALAVILLLMLARKERR